MLPCIPMAAATPSFDNSYAKLPSRFFARVTPARVPAPKVRMLNRTLAEVLGFDVAALGSEEGAQLLSGNAVFEGAEPVALAYAGHQFGNFVPQLGDGRAILLGEVVGRDGRRRDVQLKGSGRTPFSRGGDGKAALGPVLREYVVSEAMAAFGIPTTRALAAVTTGELVRRETPLPGAVLVRVASSHLRVGTFEFFAAREDHEAITILTSYALGRHYPEATGTGNDALALLEQVSAAQARLVAAWLGIGFVHGVMNTDNTSIAGETIDFGPCAFLDEYDPQKKFSSIDRGGRYAFGNQPRIAQWNLARLAETLLPHLAPSEEEAVRLATDVLAAFPERFDREYAQVLRRKLGLHLQEDGDLALATDLLRRLGTKDVDYTVFFRSLCDVAATPTSTEAVDALFPDDAASFSDWAQQWHARSARETSTPEERKALMRATNPALIPRNHRIEEAIAAATAGDFGPFEALVLALARPFDDQGTFAYLAQPPTVDQRVRETFCGT
jgi:uncharacterized protein YdiU (UPF0061 family)